MTEKVANERDRCRLKSENYLRINISKIFSYYTYLITVLSGEKKFFTTRHCDHKISQFFQVLARFSLRAPLSCWRVPFAAGRKKSALVCSLLRAKTVCLVVPTLPFCSLSPSSPFFPNFPFPLECKGLCYGVGFQAPIPQSGSFPGHLSLWVPVSHRLAFVA